MEADEPAVTVKREFDPQDESKLIAFFGILGLSEIWNEGQNDCFNRILLYRCKAYS